MDFTGSSVNPGFVNGPATPPSGVGSFRYDNGARGSRSRWREGGVEQREALNDQPVANLTGLSFYAYVEENDTQRERHSPT